ncbi:AAA family ATPase [Diaphorobacter sp. C33]|uniref:Cdc6-like AAA superfamily ATPase n=1 Tax=Diaphorobacter nitroreducens TaxID=164759 RepID=A0AAX1WRB9_9BURK|nr:TniB family NTP-binding protein [Diaphorobacter sp. C33]ROR40296.1 Cdc6-like AAA superfamily ATPase [Diaphorobacter nitroreducens]WKK90197.1 AAA family ATPase [Diaphorobacter sp. C33]
MTRPEILPSDLALVSPPSYTQALQSLRIKHTRIKQVMDELNCLIYPGSQDSILMVCGPTGVGKSALAKSMVKAENERSAPEMQADAGIIPAVYVEARASGEDDFSWRLFYQSVLEQLDTDLEIPKYHFDIDPITGRMVSPRSLKDRTLAGLRTSVERTLRHRKTRFLVIDEAAHIIHQTRRNRLEIQLDTLKSLANQTGVQIVMVGSYDLFQLMSLSGQLARRTHVLHMERYRQDNDHDIRAFHACVQKFQNTAEPVWGQGLMPYADSLHENTLGCIGTLSAILTRAAKLAETTGSWSPDHLRTALLSELQRKQILEEILDGEAAINPGLTRSMPKLPKTGAQQRKVA